jgi:hypothetical protein
MLASSFRDAHKHGLVTARKLARYQSKPGRHVAPIPEVRTIANRRDNGCGRFGPNAFDPSDALTGLARFEDGFDFLVEMHDATIEIAEEIPELGNGLTRHSRQAGIGTREYVRDHAPRQGDRLGKGDTAIKQQSAHLTDQGGSMINEALARPVEGLDILLLHALFGHQRNVSLARPMGCS